MSILSNCYGAAVDAADVDKAIAAFESAGDKAYVVGEIVDGEKGVTLC